MKIDLREFLSNIKEILETRLNVLLVQVLQPCQSLQALECTGLGQPTELTRNHESLQRQYVFHLCSISGS